MKKAIIIATAFAGFSLTSCSKNDSATTNPSQSNTVTLHSTDNSRTCYLNTTLNGTSLKLGDTTWAYSVNYVERTVTGTAYMLLFTTTGSVAFQSGTVYKSLQTGRTDSTYNLVFEGVSYTN